MDDVGLAIERLYRRRYARFLDAMSAVAGSRDAAHDAVQEGFARALRGRASFRGEGTLEAWIWRITLRAACDARAGFVLTDDSAAIPETAFPEPDRDPDLADALRALPARRRLFVFLRYFADLSYADIAEICSVSPGTVSAALAQARAELGRHLTKEGVMT
jgi:RNA polymerase sigma-70 factor (ECF subfamily)